MAKFVIVLVATTIVFSMIWGGFVTDTLYNCTDAVGFDYLHPGDWVHGQVAVVDRVVAGRSMSEPDTIKKGWSVADLWGLWISIFSGSLVVSFVLARKTWMPARNADQPASSNAGIASRWTIEWHWPGMPEPGREPRKRMRALKIALIASVVLYGVCVGMLELLRSRGLVHGVTVPEMVYGPAVTIACDWIIFVFIQALFGRKKNDV